MDDVTLISLVTIVAGIFGLMMRMCLRSKCDSVEFGCLRIHRNTNEERDVELQNVYKSNDETFGR